MPHVCSRCGRLWSPSSSSPCVSSWPGLPTAACSSTSTWESATAPTSAMASWWRPRETWRPTREAWRWSSTASFRRGEAPSSPLKTLVAARTRTAPWQTTLGWQPGPWRWEPGATCPTPTVPWWTWRAAGSWTRAGERWETIVGVCFFHYGIIIYLFTGLTSAVLIFHTLYRC